MTATQDPDLFEAVRRWIAQRLQQLPLDKAVTPDEGSTSEEEQQTVFTTNLNSRNLSIKYTVDLQEE